jgi:murein DD-endopeptidase MepM/ murein hydrolase activator NlpD
VRTLHIVAWTPLIVLVLFVVLLGLLGPTILPAQGSANSAPEQAIYFGYPLSERFQVESLYDHTNPSALPNPDNHIQIYTGAQVDCDGSPPNDCHCDTVDGYRVCAYKDANEFWTDLRWDQGHDPEGDGIGGPGWLWYDSHNAYDIGCPVGTPVNATWQGTAYQQGTHTIRIVHGAGYETYYRHLSRLDVGGGGAEAVAFGQQIGLSGDEGVSSGPHLHFEVQLNTDPVDPYGWEEGNLWAGDEPFPLGYVDQNDASRGPFLLDHPQIRDQWIAAARSLGSPVGNRQYNHCDGPPQQDSYIQYFERGYIEYCDVVPPFTRVTEYMRTFLPRVMASEEDAAWNSTIYIRNLSPVATFASITLYTDDGRVLDSRVYQGLSGRGTWEVNVHDVLDDEFLIRRDYNPVFEGTAIVAAGQDVAVMVLTESVNGVMAYTGISTQSNGTGWGEPGTAIYVPVLVWHPIYGTWESTIHVQNAEGTEARFNLIYYDAEGNQKGWECSRSGESLSPHGERDYTPSDPHCLTDGRFEGSAYLEPLNGTNLAVIVAQESKDHYGGYYPYQGSRNTTPSAAVSMDSTCPAWSSFGWAYGTVASQCRMWVMRTPTSVSNTSATMVPQSLHVRLPGWPPMNPRKWFSGQRPVPIASRKSSCPLVGTARPASSPPGNLSWPSSISS